MTGRLALPLALLAVALVGCGASKTTSTVSRSQATAIDRLFERCNGTPSCMRQEAAILGQRPVVIRCASRVTSNGSCVFADHVSAALRASGAGGGTVGLTVTGNPVSCASRHGGWLCKSRVSSVWVALAP